MLHEIVGNAHTLYIHGITVIGSKLKHGAAKTALDNAVLHSYDLPESFQDAM